MFFSRICTSILLFIFGHLKKGIKKKKKTGLALSGPPRPLLRHAALPHSTPLLEFLHVPCLNR